MRFRGPPAPSITTMTPPDGTIGTAYNQTIQLTRGDPPFTWSINSGALPENLTLGNSPDNEVPISGMPDKVQPNVKFSVTATDAKQRTATQPFRINIARTPTVAETQAGAVQGVATGNLYAFRGVPFAAPPVGDLRWNAPQLK